MRIKLILRGRPVGGCEVAENPERDARDANPDWLTATGAMLHVRRARTGVHAERFDLWRIPGRKRLTLGDTDLVLTADAAVQRVRVSLSRDVAADAGYIVSVPLPLTLRAQLERFNRQAAALAGTPQASGLTFSANRSALVHLRALQALDAADAGASHRQIAAALFGIEDASARWHADGELRAQVRYLLRRARMLVLRGYLSLVGTTSE